MIMSSTAPGAAVVARATADKGVLCKLLLIEDADIVEVGPERDGLRRFKLFQVATFTYSVRNVPATSKTVVLDRALGTLLSNGGYGQRLAQMKEKKGAELKRKQLAPLIPAPGGPDKHIYRPASKSGAIKCAACGCYSRHLADTGSCGKRRKHY